MRTERFRLKFSLSTLSVSSKPQHPKLMTIDKANSDTDKLIVWEIKFGQASVNSSPRITEADDKYGAVYPHEARMRNLTYATELFVDIALSKKELDRNEFEVDIKTG